MTEITSCQVFPFTAGMNGVKGMARVILSDDRQFTGLKIMDGVCGLYVTYPYCGGLKESELGNYYPETKELRDNIERLILTKYKEITG